jgi:flagellar hook-associated protein 2
VNVGSSSSPDYRLSVQSLNYAPDTIQLTDASNNPLLETVGNPGSYYTYQVNGQPSTPINSSSSTITLSTGLSVNLLAKGTANITVSQSTAGISSALGAFATAYNSVVDELNKNRGQNGGALSGQSTVFELQSALQNIAQYTGQSGTVSSLADLGLTFDQDGHLQFDSSVFNTAVNASSANVTNFLGSESTGGFLQAASNILTSITAPNTGMLPSATQNITQELSAIGTQITNDQTNLTNLQTSLTNQMNAANSTLSSLQSQVTEMTTLFSDMQTQQDSYNHA